MPHHHPADARFDTSPEFACVREDAGDDTATVIVAGELDLATSQLLADELRAAAPMVILDLRALMFMDCSSLALLVDATDRARTGGGRLRILRGRGIVDRLFTLTGIEHRLEMVA